MTRGQTSRGYRVMVSANRRRAAANSLRARQARAQHCCLKRHGQAVVEMADRFCQLGPASLGEVQLRQPHLGRAEARRLG